MDFFVIALILTLFVAIVLISYITIYNKFQGFIIRINEVEANIDTILRKRFDLLNKSISVIKANSDLTEVLELIVKLRSRKLTNFELDRTIYEAMIEFNGYKESIKELSSSDAFIKIDVALNGTEAEITALRSYYNNTITDYNRLVRSFPSNIVARFSQYKEKTYFDGKNMNDDITNDFKL